MFHPHIDERRLSVGGEENPAPEGAFQGFVGAMGAPRQGLDRVYLGQGGKLIAQFPDLPEVDRRMDVSPGAQNELGLLEEHLENLTVGLKLRVVVREKKVLSHPRPEIDVMENKIEETGSKSSPADKRQKVKERLPKSSSLHAWWIAVIMIRLR